MPLVLFALTVLSGVVFSRLLIRLDGVALDRKPGRFHYFFLLAGLASLVVAWCFYKITSPLFVLFQGRTGQILFFWFINSPVEELAKFLCFFLTSHLLKTIREPQDGSLQGAAVGLGFGLGENLLYGWSGGWELLLLRVVFSLPGHMIYGAIWGGYYSFEFFQGGGKIQRKSLLCLALVPAVFAHALFNTLVEIQMDLWGSLLSDGVVLAFGIFLFLRLRGLSPYAVRLPFSRWKEAIPPLEQALKLNPQAFSLNLWLGAYWVAGGEYPRAMELLEKASTLKPDALWPAFYQAVALWNLGNLSEARVRLRRWQGKAGPQHNFSGQKLAMSLIKSEDKDRWLAFLDSCR